jgi:hypothetical protein
MRETKKSPTIADRLLKALRDHKHSLQIKTLFNSFVFAPVIFLQIFKWNQPAVAAKLINCQVICYLSFPGKKGFW